MTPAKQLSIVSALAYALAFNLTFLVQELGLVIPKALTPGLHPVLFHNNHDWTGHNPLENLFQGTGALATICLGIGALGWLRAPRQRSATARLFGIWLAYCGFFLALPQFVIGAFVPRNDVGRAMDWFALPHAAKIGLAALAVVVMVAAARLIAREIVPPGLERPAGFVLRTVSLPALIGTALVLPFRVPGVVIEVAIVPLIVFFAGVPLIQIFSATGIEGRGDWSGKADLRIPAVALVALLLIFHLILRRGIAF